jgi:hypothetical protein
MFADFRIANSQGTGCLKTADQETHNHTVKDHPSRTRQSPTSNNHRLQRIGLPGQRRTPTPLMEPVPPFRGIRKVTDSQRESTEISRPFCILWPVAVPLRHLITIADGDPNIRVLRNPRPFHRFHARRNCLDLLIAS